MSLRVNTSRISLAAGIFALAVAGVASPVLGDVSINFNSNDGGFSSSFNTAAFEGPWVWSPTGGAAGTGGWYTVGQSDDVSHSCTTDLTSSVFTVSTTGAVQLSFDHHYSFENGWDGGAVFVSHNGGAYTMLDNSAFVSNGYNGALTGWGYGSELAGAAAVFSGESAAESSSFMNSLANLGSFSAGDTISIRFRAAFDSNTRAGLPSWSIDGLDISNVVPVPFPGATAVLAIAGSMVGLRRRRN
ncbi:MAG: hypothetical protein K8R92_04800 [Planctomycetes bacterium]|nr:hypothetical protein [Planctomycetota bacterium]